ncbi:MAG: calcium/proton exchanger [Isosphaeraceae bacterium]|nr:calcium/proton exchanger [Isosphaeraceae bacterium]
MLLIFVPVAAALELAEAPAVWRFLASALAIIPLAGLLGEATDQLAHRLGPGIGGLLNATFGNAAELIIALFALFRGLDDVVKASLTGSIIGNLLLVLGVSLLAGGIKHPVQRFNKTAAGVGGTLMSLAAMGMLVPALFHRLVDIKDIEARWAIDLEHKLSASVCLVLLATYGLNLLFSLVTHKDLYNPGAESPVDEREGAWGVSKATLILLAAAGLVAWMSEVLVGAIEPTGAALGLSGVFMGVIVVAIVGNAAEHSTAVWMAMKNQMDLAVGIALGSALQIALLIAPVLVLASYLRGQPMDLLFSTLEVVAVILAVIIARMVAEDGESNWIEGVMLLMLYAILGLAFYFLPHPHEPKAEDLAKPAAASRPG